MASRARQLMFAPTAGVSAAPFQHNCCVEGSPVTLMIS